MKLKKQNSRLAKTLFRFIVPVGLVGLVAFSIAAIWIFYDSYLKLNKEKVLRVSERVSALLSEEINGALSASEVLANSFSTLGSRRSQVNSLLQVVLMQNENFEGVYSIWEPNEFDQMDTAFVGLKGHDETGRFMPYWTRNEFGMVAIQASVDYETSVIGDYYVVPKNTLKKAVIDPFLYTSKGKEVFMFALVAPIKYGRNFYGVTGINLKLSTLQDLIVEKKYFEGNAVIHVFSNNGTYVTATEDPTLLGKNVMDLMNDADPLLDEIAKARQYVYVEGGKIVAKSPVIAYGLYTPWMVKVELPQNYLMESEVLFVFWLIWALTILVWISLLFSVYLYIKKRLNYMEDIVDKTKDFVSGRFNAFNAKTDDELQMMCEVLDEGYLKNKELIGGLEQILEQNYDHKVMPYSVSDKLSHTMNNVFEVLKDRLSESEQKMEEAAQQKWVREGVADINKVLRLHFNSLEELSAQLIKVVVDYLEINQGGIFVLAEREQRKPYLELQATYAYSKFKAMSKKVNLGDGIVGTCALEREVTYLTEIPDSYPFITSGLGGALPKAILVAPLIHENMVYGVIELASFSKFEQKEIDLITEISEQIAAAIASVRINAKTAALLSELQRQQDEVLAQEKTTRENLDKLQQTQEKANQTETRLRRELESARLDIIRLKTGMSAEIE